MDYVDLGWGRSSINNVVRYQGEFEDIIEIKVRNESR